MSKLFYTIAVAYAEAERDRICERVLGTMADQRKRGRFLGGTPSFGCVTVKNILSDARAKAAWVIETIIID